MHLKNFFQNLRWSEYAVLGYRILLAYLFFSISRVLFYVYNNELIEIQNVGEFLWLSLVGLTFDTSAILYANSLFVILSLFPIVVNTKPVFQRGLGILYALTNGLFLATNFVDFIYYPFSQSRLTTAVFDVVENETNLFPLFSMFLVNYWHVFLLFVACAWLWWFLYNKVEMKVVKPKINLSYFMSSTVIALFLIFIAVIGIRGGYGKATRPINMVDAQRHIRNASQADFVLNSPFCLIRTAGKNFFKLQNYLPPEEVDKILKPIKQYDGGSLKDQNVVILIMESFGREFMGAFNEQTNIPDFVSYTPFLDSLAQHSVIFPNMFANSRQSIHAMPAVLASVPSMKVAFTSSPYAKQPIQSIVSVVKEMGYDTSFFHGAPNGSMGFLGFSNILGYDHYYGKDEFNDDKEFDGFWGIWDEPFFQFMKQKLDEKQQPFLATIFSVSSHEPYRVPDQYKGVFPATENPMHQVMGYSDHALKQFFEKAKKEPWFKNTLFVLTADHCNRSSLDFYKKPINRFATPLLFYHPEKLQPAVHMELAQQMDIFPSLVDMLGYEKPIQSWGRSVWRQRPDEPPFTVHHTTAVYRLIIDKYIVVFDEKNILGIYDHKDYDLINNIEDPNNEDMQKAVRFTKAFVQDFMNRVINRKLTP